eukprot:3157982-Karenia_brevis.AAC.1
MCVHDLPGNTIHIHHRLRGGMMKGGNTPCLTGTDFHGSIKIPPSWEPIMEETYPFRQGRHDVMLWCMATDLTDAHQGPAVAMRLGGLAKAFGPRAGSY